MTSAAYAKGNLKARGVSEVIIVTLTRVNITVCVPTANPAPSVHVPDTKVSSCGHS